MRGGRGLWPREHGAYVECIAPLLTALVTAFSWNGTLFALALVSLFVMSEPVRVLLGRRGARAASELRSRAIVHAVGAGGWSLVAGIAWLSQASPRIMGAALPTVVLGVVAALAVAKRKDKTLVGELVIATTLATTLMPVGVAGGRSIDGLIPAASAWALVFAFQTLTVHALKSRRRTSAASLSVPVLAVAAIAAAAWSSAAQAVPLTTTAVVVAGALSAAIVVRAPHARALRRIGWSFALLDVVVLVLLVVELLRLPA